MMDPIKVEIEVSAATARRLNHRDQVNIHVSQLEGEPLRKLAFIYTIDPVADPQTRTFTVTMMLRNAPVRAPVPQELQGQPMARAGLVGKILLNMPLLAEGLFVNEDMLQEDEDGFFVWRILNRRLGTLPSDDDRILNVEKIRVTPGDSRLSLFGLASLRSITVAEDVQLDPNTDLLAGNVTPPDGQTTWDGDKLLYDVQRWLMRPGDLVGVDQAARAVQPGIYVPMDAIMERSGVNYVFLLVESEEGDAVRRVQVGVHESVGTLRRIEAAGDQPLEAGSTMVAAGAAFLVDGERVNVARQVDIRR
jgi:hypothetical protein